MSRFLIFLIIIISSCNSETVDNKIDNQENSNRNQRSVTNDSLRITLYLDSLAHRKHAIYRYLGFLNYYLSNQEMNLNRTYVKENKRFVQSINFNSGLYLTGTDTSELKMEQVVNEVAYLDSVLKVNENVMDI
ncbi:MAG: hypothetical protein COA32_10875 [Fluviicola sp.]|nr:MAG: hypothetical protein COA32_10875 [Fluviicola sp.]